MEKKTRILLFAAGFLILAAAVFLGFYKDYNQASNSSNVKFDFKVIPCNNSFFGNSQIVSSNWEEKRLVIYANISNYCGGADIIGDYSLSQDEITLYYKIIPAGAVTKCMCAFKGVYTFENLPESSYNFKLIESK